MAGWMQFSILWWLTGNPLAAAVLLLLGYAVADWFLLDSCAASGTRCATCACRAGLGRAIS